ncbi:MAG: chloramphenicol phosphotransferase CPT family protein [Roseiflexaceae bacterium]
MHPGTTIVLNGTTSSGKSSILRELQNLLEPPFLEAGIDKFIFMLPERYLDWPLWDEVLGQAASSGPLGHTLFSGMHYAIAAMSRAGNYILADHVFVEPRWVSECATLWAELPAYLIGVRCPLDVVEQRERDRGDRTPGQARKQYERAHAFVHYDFEIDSSQHTPRESALLIHEYILSGAQPHAFRELRDRPRLA